MERVYDPDCHDVYMHIIEEQKLDYWRTHRQNPPRQPPTTLLRSDALLDSRRSYMTALERHLAQIRQMLPSDRDRIWAVEQLARLRDFQHVLRQAATVRVQRWWRRVSTRWQRLQCSKYTILIRNLNKARTAALQQEHMNDRRRKGLDVASEARLMKESLQNELQELLLEEAAAVVERSNQAQNFLSLSRRSCAERTAAKFKLSVANMEARDAPQVMNELRH